MTSPKNPVVFALWIGEQIKLKSSISILAFETGLATETINRNRAKFSFSRPAIRVIGSPIMGTQLSNNDQ